MTAASATRGAGSGHWRAAIGLLAIVLIGGALRFYTMQRTFPVSLLGDERYYLNTALNIAQGRGHVFKKSSRLFRPPAFPFLLSQFIHPEVASQLDERGDPIYPVLRARTVRTFLEVEVVISTLLVAATGLLGWSLFGAKVALAAAGLAAVYPNFIAYGHYLWSESFFATLVTVALAGVVAGARWPGWWLAALVGLLFGVAALTREVAAGVAGMAAVWWVLVAAPADRPRTLARTALLLAATAVVILPWTWRNYSVYGRFVPVSSIGWFAAAQGNCLEPSDWLRQDGPRHVAFEREYFGMEGEMERMDFARQQTFALVASEQPSWLAKKALLNLALLFTPDSYVLYKLGHGSYRDVDPDVARWARGVSVGGYAIVLIAGILGMCSARGRGRRLLPGLVLGLVVSVHVLANADTRFRLPWMPLFIVYGAWAATHPRAAWTTLRGRAAILPAVLVVFFVAVCVPYFTTYGGRH